MSVDLDNVPFEKENKKKWIPHNNKANSSVSQHNLDVSYEILLTHLIEFEKLKDWTIIKNEICKSILPEILLQPFSMYAYTNDHKNWTQTIIRLDKLITCLSQYESNSEEDTLIQDYANTLIDKFITTEMKTVYRALNNLRGSITNPMLRLLQSIVGFNNGRYVDQFISYFDFSLPSITRVLTPHKSELNANTQESIMDEKQYQNSLRFNFIKFFTSLLSYSPSILRKDLLLENNKIMVALSKYISKVDSDECVILLLNTFIEKVINESSFKKATKCKIFHEFLLTNILKKYQKKETDIECKKKIIEFFNILFTDSDAGMVFENPKPWNSINANDDKNLIVVNDKKYKLNNKYIFNTIAKFKPWEDEMQMNILIKILHNAPELVAPYVNQLHHLNGNNEAKMTSFWIGQTLTLNRIINLPIPDIIIRQGSESQGSLEDEEQDEGVYAEETNYSIQTLIDIVVPPSITPLNLKQYINNNSDFVKHIGCQIITSILNKLKLITNFLNDQNSKAIVFSNDLINQVQSKLPDLHEYLKSVDIVYKKNIESPNLLLISELTNIMSLYNQVFTNVNNQFKLNNDNVFNKLIVKGSSVKDNNQECGLNGLELNIIDKYMELQESNDAYKWWNKNNSDFSLFTALLKMGYRDQLGLQKKITKILQNLTEKQKLFNRDILIACPITALMESLILVFKQGDMVNVWNLIDQSVQRTVTAPYKYIDMGVDFEYCSPLISCLSEQVSFFSEEGELVKKWLSIFAYKMALIGDHGCVDYVKSKLGLFFDIKQHSENIDLEKSDITTNQFCEIVSLLSINDFNSKQDTILEKLNLFLVSSDAGLNQRLINSSLFDNIFCGNDEQLISNVVKMLKKNDITLDITSKKNVYNNFINIIKQGDHHVSLNILNSLDKCSTIKYITENKDLKVDTKCNVLLLFKMIHYDLISYAEYDEYLFNVLVDCGVYIPKKVWESLFDIKDFGAMVVNKYILISSKDFLNILTEKFYSQAVQYFNNIYSENKDNITPDLIYYGSLLKLETEEIINGLKGDAMNLANKVAENEKILPDILSFIAAFCNCTDEQEQRILNDVVDYLINSSKHKFSSFAIKFITQLLSLNKIDVNSVKIWCYKCFLYINKKSAIIEANEYSSDEFMNIFNELGNLIRVFNPWQYIPKIILNTGVEIILSQKWCFKKEVVEYIINLCNQSYDEMFETKKYIQMVFNSEFSSFKDVHPSPENKNLVAILINTLFYKNVKVNSDINISLLLAENYDGTTSLKDRIFYNIMQAIEANTSVSWTQRIGSWDFIESSNGQDDVVIDDYEDLVSNDKEKLIMKEKELLSISINKSMILKTINNYRFVDSSEIITKSCYLNEWDELLKKEVVLSANENNLIYDSRFIMLLILQNNELVNTVEIDENEQTEVTRFNFKSLIRSGLFSLIIVSLSFKDDENSLIAFEIIKHMVNTLPKNDVETQKVKVDLMISIFLKKIMFSFNENKKMTPGEFAPPIFWFILSQISFIILDPKHFLYEQIYKWVLSKPKLVKYEIPIMNIFVNFQVKTQDFENLTKCLNWLLKNVVNGIKSVDDINYLRLVKMFEFILNFDNNCYANRLTRIYLNRFIERVQRIVVDYSIITRYGVLSSLESKKYANDMKMAMKKNLKTNVEEYKQFLMLLQENLNIQEIVSRFNVTLVSNKRLIDWTENDGLNISKRVCK
ncbi:uncharacterized protein HGUI_03420 [Hanseniaspora guilliermondii]|uniref:Nucleolar pre-ribosomal-associated protein 1 C-terminal domain-containing protein n=1 Tax=Hanseniaspora guilliermondii TaxID=56406 RepID=A0A1L0B5X5_9ASCO|nr:uncharacterized protein HGUI_03420 [Hanseniaspora guilliermondii]